MAELFRLVEVKRAEFEARARMDEEEAGDDDEEMFEADEADDAMHSEPAETEEPPAAPAVSDDADASMGDGAVRNDAGVEPVEPPPLVPPVHRHRSKASSADLCAESTASLDLPATDGAVEWPDMTDEQREELSAVLAQIRQLQLEFAPKL